MKKVLITGASGFVGQHLVSLLAQKYEIIGLCKLQKLEDSKNVKYFTVDIEDKKSIEKVLRDFEPEVVIHLAGVAQTHHVDPENLFKINFFGVWNVLESIKKLRDENNYSPKILHVSSSDVYGKTINPESITEDSPFYPINHYGVSKVAGDRLAYQYSQADKLDIIIFRSFPHTGPGQKNGFFVPDMISQIVEIEKGLRGELMIGNLSAIRDYLDVRDVVRIYALAIEQETTSGEAFNVCSGIGIKISDILDKILSNCSKQIKIVEDPKRIRPSEVPIHVGDPKKVMDKFGWVLEFPLDKTIKDTFDYWRSKDQELPKN